MIFARVSHQAKHTEQSSAAETVPDGLKGATGSIRETCTDYKLLSHKGLARGLGADGGKPRAFACREAAIYGAAGGTCRVSSRGKRSLAPLVNP